MSEPTHMFIPVLNGPFNHSDQLLEDPQPVPSWGEGDDGVFGKERLEQVVLDVGFAEDLAVWNLYVIVVLQKLSTEASDLVELRGGGTGAHGGVGDRDSRPVRRCRRRLAALPAQGGYTRWISVSLHDFAKTIC